MPNSRRTRSPLLGSAFLAAIVANLIHNNFGVDLAIAPPVILGGLYWWKGHRVLLWLTAFFIALPAFAFLKVDALTTPGNLKWFANHLALLAAGCLATLAVLRSLLPPKSGVPD